MLGKLSSVGQVVTKLKAAGCSNWAVTEFVQGQRTRRWAVGWSWQGYRPSERVGRGIAGSALMRNMMPFPSEFEFGVWGSPGEGKSVVVAAEGLGKKVDGMLSGLDLKWRWKPAVGAGVGFATMNVWSRSARHRKKRMQEAGEKLDVEMEAGAEHDESEDEEPALGFKVQVRQDDEQTGHQVGIRWLIGMDQVLFESLCGMLKRELRK